MFSGILNITLTELEKSSTQYFVSNSGVFLKSAALVWLNDFSKKTMLFNRRMLTKPLYLVALN